MARALGVLLIVGIAGAASARQNAMSFSRDVAAQALFFAARAAVVKPGGSVIALKSLTARGRSRFIAADGSQSGGVVEIRALLPDRYMRIDAAGEETRRYGFNAGKLVNEIRDRGRPLDTTERVRPA